MTTKAKTKPRTSTIEEKAALSKQISRLAKKYGWKPREFSDYCLRMGVNRCLSLERYKTSATSKKAAKKRVSKKVKPRAARKA